MEKKRDFLINLALGHHCRRGVSGIGRSAAHYHAVCVRYIGCLAGGVDLPENPLYPSADADWINLADLWYYRYAGGSDFRQECLYCNGYHQVAAGLV